MNRSITGMKILGAALTAVLSATAVANANAAGSAPGEDAVSVQSSVIASYADPQGKCLPPSSSAACAQWHEEIRHSFSTREIGMLFGAATSYAEFRTAYSRVKTRYERLRSELPFADNRSASVLPK